MRMWMTFGLLVLGSLPRTIRADEAPTPLAQGVCGLVTRAREPIAIDGTLAEWTGAFCTPVHFSHANLDDRAAQFLYLWDDRALYIGLRALDRHRANVGGPGSLWNGDAVEFYLDTRPGNALRGKDWTAGAIHLFYTPFEGSNLNPRWAMRQGIATSGTALKGVEVVATASDWGYEIEFAIPWANFPEFAPKPGSVLAIDAELCSGDGGGRTDRTFAYGSPLSVQQPASQGAVELVEAFDPSYLPAVGAAAFPIWVETPWVQPDRARCRAVVAISPPWNVEVTSVEVRLHDTDGAILKTLPATIEPFGHRPDFLRAVADWPIDDFAPGSYFVTARVKSKAGKTLATVAPRLVQEAQMSGR